MDTPTGNLVPRKERPRRAVICVPSNRDFPAEVADSFAGIYGRGLVEGTVTAKIVLGDTYLDAARNLLVTYALDVPTEPTHIFWMDDDMVMPSDTIGRLMAHRLPIVGGLYHQKSPPFRPVAYNRSVMGDRHVEMISLPDDPSGVVEVDGMGLGCCLVELDVYLRIAEEFGPRWHRVEEGVGEDLVFFEQVRALGIPIWLDTDVRCAHIRNQAVTTVHYQTYRSAHPATADGAAVGSPPTV